MTENKTPSDTGRILDETGFDTWSGLYDEHVSAESGKGYPFEGYRATLAFIQNTVIRAADISSVLDLGAGTVAVQIGLCIRKDIGVQRGLDDSLAIV